MSAHSSSNPTLLSSRPVRAASFSREKRDQQGEQLRIKRDTPATLADVTPGFIERALRLGGVLPEGATVTSVILERTAVSGLLSATARATVAYAGDGDDMRLLPPSVIVKLQAESEESRAMALDADNYATEALAYERFTQEMVVGTPSCFHIAHDEESGNFVFVMEDLSLRDGLYAVSQFDGDACNRSEAYAVAFALGQLHAQYWSWSGSLPNALRSTHDIDARDVVGLVRDCRQGFLASIYYTALDKHSRAAVDKVLPRAADLVSALCEGPQTLLHHDCRADNIFWGDASAPGGVVLLDWQMIGQGVGALDLAWFAAGSFLELEEADRAAKHRRVVDVYWRSLIAAGVAESRYSFESAWRDYLLGLVWSFLVVVQVVKFGAPSPVLVKFVERHVQSFAELNAHDIPFERLL